jgi:hypothetical protein
VRVIINDDDVSSDEDEPLHIRLWSSSTIGGSICPVSAMTDVMAEVNAIANKEAANKRATEEAMVKEAVNKAAADKRAIEEATVKEPIDKRAFDKRAEEEAVVNEAMNEEASTKFNQSSMAGPLGGDTGSSGSCHHRRC